GVRLWVDGRLVVDRWKWKGKAADASKPVRLVPGRRYDIRVEHHDGSGDSGMVLRWRTKRMPEEVVPTAALRTPGAASAEVPMPQVPTPFQTLPVQPTAGLFGMYFDEREFAKPTLGRVDPGIDFAWGGGSPAPAMGADTFSVRWI